MKQYDYIIVGSGLFGSTAARELTDAGCSCLVIERRDHIGGNVYSEERDGIQIHRYGAHIFHTSNEDVWQYVQRFARFNHYINAPIARYKEEVYNLPFNMNTFSRMWGIFSPEEAQRKIEEQRNVVKGAPRNLEEQAISLVGVDIYEKLIKGYTEKQWGRSCRDLPAFIIKRLPVRYTYDNNYFNDRYQGIPVDGYTKLVETLLSGIEVRLCTDFLKERETYEAMAEKIIYTGPIDEYFGYCKGTLEYRGLRFETERLEMENYQGAAVVNYTEREIPYTRIIEHKHFTFGLQPITWISREYPQEWHPGEDAYYPVNDEKNQELYQEYAELAKEKRNIIFGGRLGSYQYNDMDKTVAQALAVVRKELA